ncbi:MAG: type II secretion system protein GspM [Pseudomonadota bacterium]|nr:type II secretion system protein GspM [Pseudomonadota bacterium]
MAAEFIAKARQFWTSRTPRERRLLALGGGVLLFGLVWGLVWAPIAGDRARLEKALPKLRAEYRLMQVQASAIERLKRQSTPGQGDPLRQTEAAALAGGVRDAITSLLPLDARRVRIIGQARPASVWLNWLETLRRQGIAVESARLSRGEKAGMVSLEATLIGTAAP